MKYYKETPEEKERNEQWRDFNPKQKKVLGYVEDTGERTIAKIAKKTGITRTTIHEYLKNDKFKAEFDRLRGERLKGLGEDDEILATMKDRAMKGNVQAAKLYIEEIEKRRKAQQAEEKIEKKAEPEEIRRAFGNMSDGLIRKIRQHYTYKATDQEKQTIKAKHPHWFDGRGKLKKFYTFKEERQLFNEWKEKLAGAS